MPTEYLEKILNPSAEPYRKVDGPVSMLIQKGMRYFNLIMDYFQVALLFIFGFIWFFFGNEQLAEKVPLNRSQILGMVCLLLGSLELTMIKDRRERRKKGKEKRT